MSKYPSLAELAAQGYPGARKLELARQAEARSQKAARYAEQRHRESVKIDALVEHVSAPMRRNDHAGVIKALHDVRKVLKV